MITQQTNPPQAGRWAQSRQNITDAVSNDDYTRIRLGNRIIGKLHDRAMGVRYD